MPNILLKTAAPGSAKLAARACFLAGLAALFLVGPARASAPDDGPGFSLMSPDGAYLAGLLAASDQDTGAAADFFTQALRADPNDPQLMDRAFVADLSNGDVESAATVAKRMIRRDPNSSLAQLVVGVDEIGARRYAAARKSLVKAGGRSDVTSNLLIAWSYVGTGQTTRAIDAVNQLDQPQFKTFRDYQEGLIDEYVGLTAKARVNLKAAYDADSQTLRIVDAWARFNDRDGKPAEAQKIYQQFDQVLPNHPLIVSALAQIKAGKKLAPLVTSPQQGAAEVLYGLGAAGAQDEDVLPAMIYLRLALRLAPDNDIAAVTLAEIFERLKQHQEAIEIYQSIPERSPMRLSADIQSALIADELGRHDQAKASLTKIVASHADDVDALTALGDLDRAQKDYAGAVPVYSKALDKSGGPKVKANWTLLYFRGICEERMNKWTAAEADFKQALALDPDQPLVLNYLGYSLLDRNMSLHQAFNMLQEAAELRPDDGYIVDSLGWAYYMLGNYKEAEAVLERAVQLEPGDPVVNEHLGDALWRDGHKLEAHFQWNHARDFGPDKADLPRILNEIAHGLPAVTLAPAAARQPASAQPAKNGG